MRLFRELAADGDPSGARLLLDGAHLVHDAHRAGLEFEQVIVAASRVDGDSDEARLAATLERQGVDTVVAGDSVFAAVSPVKTPSGIVAIVRREPIDMARVLRIPDGVVVATIDVQDPGNLGAIVRTAEAFGAAGVLVCQSESRSTASPFSWKALRGSMGSALRVPIASGLDILDMLECATRAGFRSVATIARGGVEPETLSWTGRVVLLLGGEGPGLPASVAERCDARVTIAMAPEVESLNVAVAGALLLNTARRRR